MILKRIIPTLLYSKNGLYKTIKFKNKNYIGDPINTIKLFNDLKVDELILLDIDATVNKTGPNLSLINDVSNECFMPLCYGGGITSLKQAENVFKLGIEKVCINSEALNNLNLITQICDVFGSQSVVISIDLKKNIFGNFKIFSHSKNKYYRLTLESYLEQVVSAGAGEIFLTNINREGTMSGYDYQLIKKVSSAITIPIIANGGAGHFSHILKAFEYGASAVSCSSKFIYHGPHNAVLINYISEEEYLKINPIY
jgi:imidazole glycerol-phosphate synthase subunit HisF